jgi:hypothetical protein
MLKQFKNLFIPHKGNNYRPDFLERISVGIMLVLILLSFSMANLQALLWISSDWLVSTILPAVIVDLTNEERDTESLVPLTRNAILDRAATLKAEDMAQNEYFAHYSPTGVSPWYWFDQVEYNYLHAGENLAVHFTESNEVVEAWMDSPTHRANIMNGQYAEIGVGTARGEYKGRPTIYVVQLFGTPRSIVAGAATDIGSNEITVEKVAITPEPADVAPATVDREEITTNSEPEPDLLALAEPDLTEENLPILEESAVTEPVTVYESLATTSRDGEPAVPASLERESYAVPLPLQSATAASLWLETLYAFLALVVVGALTVSLALEWRRHNLIQTAYAGGLLVVMALLLYIHTALTGQVLIV